MSPKLNNEWNCISAKCMSHIGRNIMSFSKKSRTSFKIYSWFLWHSIPHFSFVHTLYKFIIFAWESKLVVHPWDCVQIICQGHLVKVIVIHHVKSDLQDLKHISTFSYYFFFMMSNRFELITDQLHSLFLTKNSSVRVCVCVCVCSISLDGNWYSYFEFGALS